MWAFTARRKGVRMRDEVRDRCQRKFADEQVNLLDDPLRQPGADSRLELSQLHSRAVWLPQPLRIISLNTALYLYPNFGSIHDLPFLLNALRLMVACTTTRCIYAAQGRAIDHGRLRDPVLIGIFCAWYMLERQEPDAPESVPNCCFILSLILNDASFCSCSVSRTTHILTR